MKIKGLTQRQPSGTWYYQPPQVNGYRPSKISLKTKERSKAIERYTELVQSTSNIYKPGRLAIEIERYLDYKIRGNYHTPRTSETTRETLEKLVQLFGEAKEVHRITTDQLRDYQTKLQDKIAASTLVSTFGRISGFFTWCAEEGIIEQNPCAALRMPRVLATRAEKYCTRDERDRIITTVTPGAPIEPLLWLGFFGGLRIGEIVECRVDWLDLAAGTLTVQNTDSLTTKDKHHRTVRLSPRFRDYLSGYLPTLPADSIYVVAPEKIQKGSHRLRFDPRKSFKTLVNKCDLPWVSYHTMRHTFATLHAIGGTPMSTIARELGDDIQTTFNNYVGYSRHDSHSSAID